jgi:hypothetical protein
VAVLRQALSTIRWLARATSWLAWLFSTPSRKSQVRSRASGFRRDGLAAQAADSLQKLLAGLDRAQQIATKPDSAITEEWRASSPSHIAALEQLLSRSGTAEERGMLRRGLDTRFSSELLQ